MFWGESGWKLGVEEWRWMLEDWVWIGDGFAEVWRLEGVRFRGRNAGIFFLQREGGGGFRALTLSLASLSTGERVLKEWRRTWFYQEEAGSG